MSNLNLVDNTPRCFGLLLLFFTLAILITCKPVTADENRQKLSESATLKRKPSGPYCGLYCLYSAMKLADKDIDFRKLAKPEYLGSRNGSSLAELKKAAEDNGLFALPVGKLSSRELRELSYPIILHVKSSFDSKEYDHYELYLGAENGLAKLFDPPNPARLVPFHGLAPRWDGNGLIVSTEPIDIGDIFASARKRFTLFTAIIVALILLVRTVRKFLLSKIRTANIIQRFGFSAVQGATLGIIALFIGVVYHFANDEGFLAHANATTSIQQAHVANFIPKINKKEVKNLLNTGTVLIDARYSKDFKKEHIEGAINIPVNLCDKGCQAALAKIDKKANIVVYCQSARCKFAQEVAGRLKSDGFSNILIYKDGWIDWNKKNSD